MKKTDSFSDDGIGNGDDVVSIKSVDSELFPPEYEPQGQKVESMQNTPKLTGGWSQGDPLGASVVSPDRPTTLVSGWGNVTKVHQA